MVWLDFGCTVAIPRAARLGLLTLILGAIENDETDPATRFSALDFDADKLEPIAHLLPALSKILLGPFTSPTPFA